MHQLLVYDSGDGKGGSRRTLLSWVEALQDSDRIRLKVVCGSRGWLTEQLEAKGIPYHYLPEPSSLRAIQHSTLSRPFTVAWLALITIPGLLSVWLRSLSFRMDGVVLTHPRALMMLFPSVLLHRRTTVVIPASLGFGTIPFAKLACRLASVIFPISEPIGESLIQSGIQPSKIKVAQLSFSSLPTEKTDRSKFRADVGIPQKTILLGIVGTLCEIKGQVNAIHALSRLRVAGYDAHLLVIGGPRVQPTPEDVRYVTNIYSAVTELGLEHHVHFLGWREDVTQIVGALDLLLIPSTTEGVPRVAIEAMAQGIPIVGSDIASLRDMILADGVGFVAPVENHQAFADIITRIVDNPRLYAELSAKAYDTWKWKYSIKSAKPVIETTFLQLFHALSLARELSRKDSKVLKLIESGSRKPIPNETLRDE